MSFPVPAKVVLKSDPGRAFMEMTNKNLLKLSEKSKIGYPLAGYKRSRTIPGQLRKYLELGYIAESEEGEGKRARKSLC